MIPELGHYALALALALAIIQSFLPLWGVQRSDMRLMLLAPPSAILQFLLIALAFAALCWAYLVSDFTVLNVASNSHSAQPTLYKITGVWGNHEGSMLLWVLILALFGALVALFGRNLPPDLRAGVLAVQGWIAMAFLAFILFSSNPFVRLASPPVEGRDLNPVLQDIGLAIHPPLLYIGYVGFSIAYAFAIAALITGRVDAAWARWVRPWTLAAWIFLTLGIAMGSYWAYYELGWGGWWFWDPVENASFMPWLAGTALLHSAIVIEKRGALKVWTILLAILTFSLSLLGTFLVRSGVLTSVHAFASDPARGVVILFILSFFVGGGLLLYAWRAPHLKAGGLFAPISREGALVINNLFLATACFTVLLGTLYPLAMDAIGYKISVGAPFFNATFGPLMVIVLLIMPLGPLLAWKRADIMGAAQRLLFAVGMAFAVASILLWYHGATKILSVLGIALAVFVMLGALSDLAGRVRFLQLDARAVLARLIGLPGAAWGTVLAHFGMGMTLLGIVCVSAFETEIITSMEVGETRSIAGYELRFIQTTPRQGPNYREEVGTFELHNSIGLITPLETSKRIYTAGGMPTTEAAMWNNGFSQIYITIGDIIEPVKSEPTKLEASIGRKVGVKIYHKPLVLLIWLGCVVMAFGGFISLLDRRLRVGAPKKATVAQATGAEL